MKTQNTIIGILGGIVVGAIAGILLAPDKGENTRAKLAAKATDLKNDMANQAITTKNSIEANVEAKRSDVSQKLDVLKKAGNEILDKSKSELAKVKAELKS